MRINRYLASSGLASRRGAESLVLAGRVAVNGKVILELGTTVKPGVDVVEVDGEKVSPPREHTYWILNKPVGYLTTARDPHGRATIMNLIPASPRVFPVGRLDQDTSGLLLLTDDGDLSHRLLHPRYKVEKEYWVVIDGYLEEESVRRLQTGLRLEDGKTAPAKVEILERTRRFSKFQLTITEGRNRQVRRMLEALGHPVVELHRARVGSLDLGPLKEGTFRELSRNEVRALRRLVQN